MPHFYVSPENISEKEFRIIGEDVHYLADVRRYGVGDRLKLFDGKGCTMMGEINFISKDEIRGILIGSESACEPAVAVHLYQSVPKGERFDWFVEKAAELGVEKVTPIITERSVTREISDIKIERWRRLSKAACQQCGRSTLMEITGPIEFADAVKVSSSSGFRDQLSLIPWEAENVRSIKESFESRLSLKKVNIFIGPEGGFSTGEIEAAKTSGVVPVTLGNRILRAETAGLLAAILVANLAGEYEIK